MWQKICKLVYVIRICFFHYIHGQRTWHIFSYNKPQNFEPFTRNFKWHIKWLKSLTSSPSLNVKCVLRFSNASLCDSGIVEDILVLGKVEGVWCLLPSAPLPALFVLGREPVFPLFSLLAAAAAASLLAFSSLPFLIFFLGSKLELGRQSVKSW